LGAVSQSFGAFNHILSDFSLLINQFEQISAFSAGLTRLSTFIDRIDEIGSSSTTPSIAMTRFPTEPVHPHAQAQLLLEVRNLTVITPDRSRVILGGRPGDDSLSLSYSGVDMRVCKGDRVLLVGSSGSGKSTFVRAIAGLWQNGYGSIAWRDTEHIHISEGKILAAPKYVFFLPQKPYNLIGSLKQQIMYPNVLEQLNSTSPFLSSSSRKPTVNAGAYVITKCNVTIATTFQCRRDGNLRRGCF
jgi:ABC-type uncharacterized transport system fused permease/ATPase subunit